MTNAQARKSDGAWNGIDCLARDGFALLAGRRIGLITNHTGADRDGALTADLLHRASDIRLVSLFSPEHGLRGLADEAVPDGRDPVTRLTVHSLYGERRKPSPEQLAGLDTLVFDIQDIGARFYTYVSTLGLCLESAAEHGLRFVVLDRPNPIGGMDVEGPLPDSLSFTAFHSIPIRHGMTIGELARMFARERGLPLEPEVVKVEGWRRRDMWDATNLTWIDPSPNMRSLTAALLYPGIGLLETTNVSVGRGTDRPFELFGAPWIDGRSLCASLNALDLPGVRFVPVRFTPASSTHAGCRCGGANAIITTRDRFVPVATGLAVAATLRALFRDAWRAEDYNRLLASSAVHAELMRGASERELARIGHGDVAAFRIRRRPFLLYG